MAYKRDKLIKSVHLPRRFDYWMDKESVIIKQIVYDYIHLYGLMSIVLELLNCQVSMSYFVKNYEVLMIYFKSSKQPGNNCMIVYVTISFFGMY